MSRQGQTVNVQKLGVPIDVTFDAGATVSDVIDIQHAISGLLEITSEFNTDTLTFQGSPTRDGTFRNIENSGGTLVSVAAAGNTYLELADAVMKAGFITITTGSATGAAATLKLILK